MKKSVKQAMKVLIEALYKAGYFINVSKENKNVFYVLSTNPNHDTLTGVWRVINDEHIYNISVHRCPDDRVIQVKFETSLPEVLK